MGSRNTGSGVGKTLDLQELGAELRIYGEIEGGLRHFNPSLSASGGGIDISVRSCNFAVERGGKWYFRDDSAYSKTDVLIGWVDPTNLTVFGLKKAEISNDSPINVKLAGLEDVRLFNREDGLYAIGFESDRLTRTLHNDSAGMAVFKYDNSSLKYIKSLPKPKKEIVEKNWCPPDQPSNLFDYTYSDTQVYKDGKLIGQPSKTQIHGGTVLLKQKDGTYLSLVHEKKLAPGMRMVNHKVYDKYVYYTYLARHNKQGIITHLTPPFRFGTLENIEFASGLVEWDDDFIISLGIRDCKYALCIIAKHKLVDLLKEV